MNRWGVGLGWLGCCLRVGVDIIFLLIDAAAHNGSRSVTLFSLNRSTTKIINRRWPRFTPLRATGASSPVLRCSGGCTRKQVGPAGACCLWWRVCGGLLVWMVVRGSISTRSIQRLTPPPDRPGLRLRHHQEPHRQGGGRQGLRLLGALPHPDHRPRGSQRDPAAPGGGAGGAGGQGQPVRGRVVRVRGAGAGRRRPGGWAVAPGECCVRGCAAGGLWRRVGGGGAVAGGL